jgi:hypothetical protein
MARRTRHRKYRKIYKRKTMKGGIRIPEDVVEDFDESVIEAIPDAPDDSHNLNMGENDTSFDLNESNISNGPLNQSFGSIESNGSLNLSDLNVSGESDYTTEEDNSLNITGFNDSFGQNNSFDQNNSLNTTRQDISFGGKKRKNSKKRHVKKGKKTRKNRRVQKGGVCYGNGVGANSYDPNYSIYNTNMLKLFPYKA